MRCRWMHDPEIGRWWYPQCIGGICGKEGCTCPRGTKAKQDRMDQLEKRIEKLERQLNEPCQYCGDGKRTGLPSNACENCMNTGLKYPPVSNGDRA